MTCGNIRRQLAWSDPERPTPRETERKAQMEDQGFPQGPQGGWKMYRRGKIRLFPASNRAKEVQEIFKTYEKGTGKR